jgi:hypothetical protein
MSEIWSCKIGGLNQDISLPSGADSPMREAVRRAYKQLTGIEPQFIFSGWGAQLTDSERSVVLLLAPRPFDEETPK